jgi:hypothetical protein
MPERSVVFRGDGARMSDPEGAVHPVLVGNRRSPRYAIAVNHSPSSPPLYWTGMGDNPWTTEVSGSMKWADYGAVMAAIRGMGTAESDDSPGSRRWDAG